MNLIKSKINMRMDLVGDTYVADKIDAAINNIRKKLVLIGSQENAIFRVIS